MVLYNYTDITDQLRFSSLIYESFASGSADMMRMLIADPEGAWLRQPPEPGDVISITGNGIDTGDMYVHVARRVGRYTSLLVTAMPPGMKDPHTESWQSVRLEELVKKKAERHGLSPLFRGVPNQLYQYVMQHDESDAAFLSRLLAAESCTMQIRRGLLIVSYEPTAEAVAPGADLSFGADATTSVRDARAEMFARCELTCGGITASFEDPNPQTERVMQKTADGLFADTEQTVARFARGTLRALNKNALVGSVLLTDRAGLVNPGTVIDVDLPGSNQWSGPALVESVRRDLYYHTTTARWRRLILEGY